MTKVLIALLLILSTISIVGIIKYNIELNTFKKEIIERPKSKTSSKDNRTKVHIVGTMHFETDKIKRLDFYNLIDNISPSIILYESDSVTLKRILKKRDYFFRVMRAFQNKKEIEKPVTLTYIENNLNCVVLPYEWELRDKYHRKHKLRKRSKKMINAVIKLNSENLLTNEQSTIINRFLELNRELMKIEQDATIADINNSTTDSILKQRQYYIYTKIPEIVTDRKELSKYLDFVAIYMNYWDIRNKAMAQNILKQIKLNPNKVIVVLNGFYHRYYLIDELKKYENEYEFTIKDL
ncbi:hypothetical protein [Psychroserpens sp.]